MQTFISCAKVQLKLKLTIRHLLRMELMMYTQMQKHAFKANDAHNEVKACS